VKQSAAAAQEVRKSLTPQHLTRPNRPINECERRTFGGLRPVGGNRAISDAGEQTQGVFPINFAETSSGRCRP